MIQAATRMGPDGQKAQGMCGRDWWAFMARQWSVMADAALQSNSRQRVHTTAGMVSQLAVGKQRDWGCEGCSQHVLKALH